MYLALVALLQSDTGADNTVVASLISTVDAFLATHNSADWSGLTRAQKNTVNSWAATLDNYNNGLIGPGHCSESGIPIEPEFPEDENVEETCNCSGININIFDFSHVKVYIKDKKEI